MVEVHRPSFPQGLVPLQQLFLPILPLQAHPGIPHTITKATAPLCEQGNLSLGGRTMCFSCLATEGTWGSGGGGEGGCEVHHEGRWSGLHDAAWQDQAPRVPPAAGGEDAGAVCFPFACAHVSQGMGRRQLHLSEVPSSQDLVL